MRSSLPPTEIRPDTAISEDDWLSARLGHPVYTVRAAHDPAKVADDVRRHAATQSSAMYQAKVAAERVDAVAELTATGFTVVNANLTLARRPVNVDEPAGGAIVREADPQFDEAALVRIGEHGFRASRFHLDPRIPQRIADAIKREWVRNCLVGKRGSQLLVAVIDDAPIGFLAVIEGRIDERQHRTIDLIAVAPDARNRAVGTALVRHFLDQSVGRCDVVRVGTQAANIGATRFYERHGFVADEAAFDLHLHAGDVWPQE